jgi:DNA-binding Lrp family transcriptional regulator
MSPFTVRKRIEFLQKRGVIKNFVPNLRPAPLGLNLLLFAFFKIDFSDGRFESQVVPALEKSPNFISFGKLVGGGGTFNFYSVQLFRGLQDYNLSMDLFYNKKFPFLHEVIKEKQVFFVPVTEDSKILELEKLPQYLAKGIEEKT